MLLVCSYTLLIIIATATRLLVFNSHIPKYHGADVIVSIDGYSTRLVLVAAVKVIRPENSLMR